jgi:SAM-dependent methyltransferase
MILRTRYEQTEAHAREMAACAEMVDADKCWHKETLDSYAALNEFYKGYFSGATGKEFVRATKAINDGSPIRILDFGAGRGETSLYLADHGHTVFPVEPSYEFCQVIDHMSCRFGKNLTIYNSSAEHLDISGVEFDIAIFNVSLHHCDDPLMALKNAYRLLRSGGTLLLVSEPMLPFFKSHEGMQRDLASAPEEFGHYGGNEHSYHHAEYVSMMRQAGFRNIKSEIVARYRSKDALKSSMAADHRPPGVRKQLKYAYLNTTYLLERAKLKPLLHLMKVLSLVQLTFSASK